MNWTQRLTALLWPFESKKASQTRNSEQPIFASASQDGKAIFSSWSTDRAIAQGMKANVWVYAAIGKIAGGLASVPLVLEKRQGNDWQADPDHELQALLNQPNPFMARQDMLERWTQHMMLAGNAIWWLNIVAGKPLELWPVPPDSIKPIQSRSEFVAGYEWRMDSSTKRVIPPDQVAHWMFPDPADQRWGLSPLQAASAAVDMDQAAARWNRAVLANDGKPPIGIILDSSLSLEQQKLAAGFIKDQIDGGAVRRALVLGGTSKVVPLALNATDLDFLNGRKFSREEISAVFGVPPILLAFGEGATYANLDAAKTALWEDRIVPLLDDLCNGLMQALFRFWSITQANYRIRADLRSIRALQANLKTEAEVGKIKADTFATMVNSGVPPNMAAKAVGLSLETIPGGDQPKPQAQAPPVAKKAAGSARIEIKADEANEVRERLARMDEWTDEVRKRVAELLIEQGNAIAAAYASGSPWERQLSLDDWRELLTAIHTAVIEAEGAVAYSALLVSVVGTGGGGTFDVLADGVVEWIDKHVGKNIKYINDATMLAMRAEVAAGVEAGESTKQIAGRLKALHTDWAGWRADRIARTEVHNAFSAAHQLTAQQMAVEFNAAMAKTWRATKDTRTRDEHAAMDGETVPIDEPFSNGLMVPGEPNCRCVLLYTVLGDI